METPFIIDGQRIHSGPVHLLPSPNATLVVSADPALQANLFVPPHRTVIVVDDALECISLTPNVVKCLIGEPRRFLGLTLSTGDHPMLRPFAEIGGVAEASELLTDLRHSLTVTSDESDFVGLWSSVRDGLPTSDRRVQRLCARYAGQSPKAVNMTVTLARTLDADNISGQTNTLGDYADDSHLGRVCRAFTGRTPTAWRNMSQTFY